MPPRAREGAAGDRKIIYETHNDWDAAIFQYRLVGGPRAVHGVRRRGADRAGGGKIRLGDFLLPGEALTRLEAERSVSGISCSQERRLPGWRWKDPSRGFLAPRRGAHRAGGVSGISCSQERRSPGWRWKDPSRGLLAPTRGAHRVGGGKIRLGDDPSRTMIYSYSQERRSPGWRWKDPSGISCSQERRSPGWDFLLPGEALNGLEAGRSVSGIYCSQERRSPGWRLEDPSRGFLAPRRGAHRVSAQGRKKKRPTKVLLRGVYPPPAGAGPRYYPYAKVINSARDPLPGPLERF